ncbi:nucleotide exchange factor GrpE [Halorubrum sp. 48-1-W]|uniref:nucleotide exchange factor GrpE n=1 Tax=Halorubrum sp. 48-1-W TaxID=2249761 RepID=UPI000DCF4E7F|nr:nucleotide exchange factor GrpE [Halorubrum sp. 48-1-W]RAW45658.1 nucleotide exchange factor GrpE [Halorubrum sp. 48-1-W]
MSDDDAVEVGSPGEPDATAEDAGSGGDAAAEDATEVDGDAGGGDAGGGDAVEPTLADRVAEHDEALAEEVADLESELDERREEVDELTGKLARVRADFSNYKQRAKRKREEIRERASEALVERIVPVRNDLKRALDQEDGSDIRPGVESTLGKFDEVLADEGVEPIEPEPGEAVDPARHQVMLRVDSDQPDGTVHEVYEPGYEMGDRVIIEAQVTVSDDDE